MKRLILPLIAGLLLGLGGTSFLVIQRTKAAVAAMPKKPAARHGADSAHAVAAAKPDSAKPDSTKVDSTRTDSTNTEVAHADSGHQTQVAAAPTNAVSPAPNAKPGAAHAPPTTAAPSTPVTKPVAQAPQATPRQLPNTPLLATNSPATLPRLETTQERRLAKVFATMPAREAARVLEQMDDRDIQTILSLLADRQAAAILGSFTPQRAAAIGRLTLRTPAAGGR